jgi:hypothetical protein
MVTNKKRTKASSSMPRCDKRRCLSPAELFPVIVIPAPKWAQNKEARIEMEMDLNVCSKHAIEDINLFIDDAGYEQVVHALGVRRLAKPDRKTIYVIFKPLEDRKVQS